MIEVKKGVQFVAGLAAISFLISSATFAEAGRVFYGSSGGSSGSSGGWASSGGSYGSYGSSGGIVSRRAWRLRHRYHGSSGGYHHSSGGYSLGSYGSSGGYSYGSYGSSGGYGYGSYGSSGGYSHLSHGSSGGSSGGSIILQAPVIRSYPVPAPMTSEPPIPMQPNPVQPKPVDPKSYTPLKAPKPVTPKPEKKEDNQARMTIHVPEDAIVSLNHQHMAAEGKTRRFISPILPTKNEYAYTVTVEVIRDGQPVTIMQKQIIRAGGNYELTFVEQNGALVFVAPAQKMKIAAQ